MLINFCFSWIECVIYCKSNKHHTKMATKTLKKGELIITTLTREGNIVTMKESWQPNCFQIIVKTVYSLGDGVCVSHIFGELFFNSLEHYIESVDLEWMEDNTDYD